jgi:CyaY protein
MSDAISEQDFEKAADVELRALDRALGELDREDMEVDLESGILTIEFEDGTQYVVNSHRAARQIWMAAERSAWHFDPQPEDPNRVESALVWRAGKSDEELWSTLEAVMRRKLGPTVRLPR